jgi:hypothetical protein
MSIISQKSRQVPFDLVFLGVLLIMAGGIDSYLIFTNPKYAIPTFGMKLAGPWGWFFKLMAPPIHFLSGYGVAMGRRWAYLLLMGYSLYGLLNASINRLLLPGPHRIRTVFILGTLLFVGYLYMRRSHFKAT